MTAQVQGATLKIPPRRTPDSVGHRSYRFPVRGRSPAESHLGGSTGRPHGSNSAESHDFSRGYITKCFESTLRAPRRSRPHSISSANQRDERKGDEKYRYIEDEGNADRQNGPHGETEERRSRPRDCHASGRHSSRCIGNSLTSPRSRSRVSHDLQKIGPSCGSVSGSVTHRSITVPKGSGTPRENPWGEPLPP